MTKILIPADYIELTGVIQQCLLVADEQGFTVSGIELGVSPTHTILVSNSNDTIGLVADLYTDLAPRVSQDYSSSYVFSYHSTLALSDFTQQAQNVIFLALDDGERCLDVWHHPLNGEVRALSFSSNNVRHADNPSHLSWIVTLLALDFPLEDCLTLARAMVNVSRETWTNNYAQFPTPVIEDSRLGIKVGWGVNQHQIQFPTLAHASLGLYPVVDSVEWIERLLNLGIKTLQLRIKNPDQSDLEQQIKRAILLGKQFDAQVFINDYWQLAIEHGAYGVHLGQEDLEESNLKQLSDAGIRLGLSTHGYYELLRIVQIAPSYIALGHIFPTTTKQMPSKPQGLIRLALYQKLIDTIPYGSDVGVPTVAIGGIDLANARAVWQCGVSSLAVVRAITLSSEPQQVIQAFADVMASREMIEEPSHVE
ncbi:thiamine phosphate synthase [Vibrio japonicus]|uniref:Thiamine-phosphate synthase n=1 Tax=Vibrio japonicus TaxID=1824638 RepID=A0ABY5LQ62_9VIBR|nr:thiamine phosphate synthase [Vibrio japonicus]UUM31880.1 thiamine phosphate synthase [Vibrio japonicus]